MKRVNTKTLKHNLLISRAVDAAIIADIRERDKAARKQAKLESLDYRIALAQRKCVQQLYKPEKNYELLIKKGIVHEQLLNNAEFEIIKAIDVAAIQSLGRILAEIKTKQLDLKEMIDIQISYKDFYKNFENFYEKNFSELNISKEEFNKIIKPYIDINLHRIRTLGTKFAYYKAANKLESNIVYLEKVAVKEQNLSL